MLQITGGVIILYASSLIHRGNVCFRTGALRRLITLWGGNPLGCERVTCEEVHTFKDEVLYQSQGELSIKDLQLGHQQIYKQAHSLFKEPFGSSCLCRIEPE
jgi:hypothetical protein